MSQEAVSEIRQRRRAMSVMPAVAGTVCIVLGGVVHGMWTDRWTPADRSDAVGRLDAVPDQFHDWVLIEEGTVSKEEQQMAELSGYELRHYRSVKSGDVVTMLLMCGPAGPVAVHPPTACYTGRGYEQVGGVVPHDVEIAESESQAVLHGFMSARFHRPGSHSGVQPCIYWGWTTNGEWSVPANPRLQFAGERVLFKLYVTCESSGQMIGTDEFPPAQFLQDVIPVLKETVFESGSAASVATGIPAR